MRCCEVLPPIITSLRRDFVEAGKNVSGVDKGDYAVQVDVTSEAVVDPEKWCEVTGVGQAGGFEEDVRYGGVGGDKELDRGEAGVSE